MNPREEFAIKLRMATEELKYLQTAVEFDPDAAFDAFQRAVLLVGSAALLLGCPESFDLP